MVVNIDNYSPINFANALLLTADERKLREYRENYLEYQLNIKIEHSFASCVRDLQESKIKYVNEKEYVELIGKATAGNNDAKKELEQIKVLFAMIDEAQVLMTHVETVFRSAKKNHDEPTMYELEQVLGRAKLLLSSWPQPLTEEQLKSNGRDVVLYNAQVIKYNQNIDELGKLANHLSHHASPRIRNIGAVMMAMGALAVIGFIILVSVPSFGAPFVSALSSLGFLGTSILIGSELGLSSTTIGAAVVGSGGLIAASGAGLTFYKSDKNRISHTLTKYSGKDKTKPHNNKKDSKVSAADVDDIRDIENAFILLFSSDPNPNVSTPAVMKNQALRDFLLKQLLMQVEQGTISSKVCIDQLNFAQYDFKKNQRYDVLFEDLVRLCGLFMFKMKVNPISESKPETWCFDIEEGFSGENPHFIEQDMTTNNVSYRFVIVDTPNPLKALGIKQPIHDEAQFAEAYSKTKLNAQKHFTYSKPYQSRYDYLNEGEGDKSFLARGKR